MEFCIKNELQSKIVHCKQSGSTGWVTSFHIDDSQSTGDAVVGHPECKCHVRGKVTYSEGSLRQHVFRVHHKQPGKSAIKGNVAGMECKV